MIELLLSLALSSVLQQPVRVFSQARTASDGDTAGTFVVWCARVVGQAETLTCRQVEVVNV